MRASPACRSASSERVLGRASLAAAVLISAAWLGSCAKLRGMKVAPKKDPKATPDAAPPPAGPTAKAPPEAPPAKRPDTPTAPTAPAASTRPGRKRLALLRKRVLFIGNSYTSHNDMPLMLQKLAEAAHEQERVHFKRFTVGGCTLEKHWLRTGARLEVRKSTWDYVVLQEQSMRPIERRELMHKYARLFGAEIMMAEAKTVFFLTWPRQHRPHDQEALTDACVSIAKELKAQVAPVGVAWQSAVLQQPALRLYAGDKSHPTRTGSYLAACVFYATLYGKTPMGLPGRLITTTRSGKSKTLINLPPQRAMLLQETAWDAVRRMKARMR